MFKKYYKEANDDIKADEVFINNVIKNARKKRVPSQKSYFKYTLTAAAAVVVLSATAVTMPLLSNNNNDGIISVVTQTAQPEQNTVTNTPTHSPINTAVPNPPAAGKKETEKTKPRKAEKEKTNETQKVMEKEEKNEPIFRAAKDTAEVKQETIDALPEVSGALMFSAALEDSMADESTTAGFADSGAVTSDSIKNIPEAAADTNNAEKYSGGGSSTKVSGAATSMQSAVLPPSGYYVTEAGNGRYVFTSDNGAAITVITEITDGADTEPVYDGLNVSFTAQGTKFNITSDGAEKSAIDELVNSLR